MTSQSSYPPEDDEDTLELELTAEEMLGLSRAAKEAQPSTTSPPIGGPLVAAPPVRAAEKQRFRRWPLLAVAAALAGIAAAVARHGGPSHREAPPVLSSPTVSRAPPAAFAPAALTAPPEPPPVREPAVPPVRVKNPFDAKEVFEFPAGTTRTEARKKVSELLLQRAADRGSRHKDLEHQ